MKRIFWTDIHPASGGFGQYEAGIPEEVEGGGYYGGDVMAYLDETLDWGQYTVTHKFDGRIMDQYGSVIVSDIDEEEPMFMYWVGDDEPAKLLWDYDAFKAEKDALEFFLEFHGDDVPWGFIRDQMDEWTRNDVEKELGGSCDHVKFLLRYLELAECDLQLWEHDRDVWKRYNVIWTAQLSRNDAGEYVWSEKNEAEFGDEWGGNLEGYVENAVSNLDDPDEYEIRNPREFTIHNSPEHGLVVCWKGYPHELLWIGNAQG